MSEPTKHTPEPWSVDGTSVYIHDAEGRTVAKTTGNLKHYRDGDRWQEEANARRIVACVNFCEGRTTEELERAVGADE